MQIAVDFPSFVEAHEKVEASREDLSEAKLNIESRASKSKAMDQCEDRAKELKKLIREYEELLKNDSWALFQSSTSFADMDSAIAGTYAQGMYDAYGMCPVKGASYYDAYSKQKEKVSSAGGVSSKGVE